MSSNGKNTNSLMRHIRKDHNINISSSQKRRLEKMGYYHGYKAYSFYRKKNDPLRITSFKEILAISEFDKSVKVIIYPNIMELETVLKNYTIDILVSNSDPTIDKVFFNSLNRHLDYTSDKKRKKYIENRLRLKKSIYEIISRNYSKEPMISHYINNGKSLPIWAIFEFIDLGTFGQILDVLNKTMRENLSKKIVIYNQKDDTDSTRIIKDVFILKPLRNAIAHGKVTFDCRFQDDQKNAEKIGRQLSSELAIENITFDSITDYVILIIFYFKALKYTKTEIRTFLNNYKKCVNKFANSLNNQQLFHKILNTDVINKLDAVGKIVDKL